MTKTCVKCRGIIDEFNSKCEWGMIITKRGFLILELKAFHFQCWRDYLKLNLEILNKQTQTKDE
jgi:hypothetical protein